MSLLSAIVPVCLKAASVTPLLKKSSLDREDLKNYRPVSNLPYLSKLIEKVVVKRLNAHMTAHNKHEYYQSAYRSFHSTETALLRVHNDLLQAVDNKQCVYLVLLDQSAAFDTVEHSILLSRLENAVGVTGSALDLCRSYLQTGHSPSMFLGCLPSRGLLLVGCRRAPSSALTAFPHTQHQLGGSAGDTVLSTISMLTIVSCIWLLTRRMRMRQG